MQHVLMACGHVANSMHNGQPACVICAGIKPGALTVADVQPDLTGRIARCGECPREKPSSLDLPFFEYRPDRDRDSFYDGCHGWD